MTVVASCFVDAPDALKHLRLLGATLVFLPSSLALYGCCEES